MGHTLGQVSRRVARGGGNYGSIYVVKVGHHNMPLNRVVTRGVCGVRNIHIPATILSVAFCHSSLNFISRSPIFRPYSVPFSIGSVRIVLISSILCAKHATHTTVRTMVQFNETTSVRFTILVSHNRHRLPVQKSCINGGIPASGDRFVSIGVPPCSSIYTIRLCREIS